MKAMRAHQGGQGLDDQATSISCIPMHPDRLKRGLEDLLLERGIEFVYSSIPIARIMNMAA